ncbi:MAG TPA: inositol monophosphatase [Candidatus Paceibacterota bacterium]
MSYTDKILPIVKEAGIELRQFWGNPGEVKTKGGGAQDVVTELDRKTELFLAEQFRKIYPDIEFFGEEFGGNKTCERFWLVDPIDGTAHFVRGMPFCTTMVALIESGKVVFSAIYDFVNDKMYSAEKGQGAKMNGTPIHVSNRSLNEAYLTREINVTNEKNLEIYLSLRKKCILFNTISCGFEFTMVASGKIEGRISLNPYGKDYDYAPGTFLVSEAGGKVTNIGSEDYDFRNTSALAANPKVYEELKKLYNF